MKNQDYNCSITANISASEAMKRISNVPGWWGVTFTGSAEKQGDQFVVKMGGDSFFNFTVTTLTPGKKIVWLVTDCYMPWYTDKKEWTGTKLIFDLSEDNGVTMLNFTHEGLTPQVECYKDCETGWTHWISTSLLSYLTTGEGQKKNKITQCYTTSIEVPFSPKIVFSHINSVAKWWPEDFAGESTKLNDEFTLTTGDMHYSKQKLVECIQDKKVVWLTTESLRKTDNYEWTGTKMSFELTPKNNGTLLNFTYDGPVLENETDRLAEQCDMVIKDKLYNFIMEGKTNKNNDFHRTIVVNASPAEAMKKIGQVNLWWAKNFKGKAEKEGDNFSVHFGDTFVDFQVSELIPDKKVVWKVTDCNLHWINDKKEWKGTDVVFDLSAKGSGTQIDFTHIGLVPGVECYNDCEVGWNGHITNSLVKLMNDGNGMPE